MSQQPLNLLVALGSALIFYLLSSLYFDELQARLISAIILLVMLWTNEALPMGITSLLPVILFPILGIMDTNTTAENYSKSIIFLFIGGFLLAIATKKIHLHHAIAVRLLHVFPTTPKGILLSLAATAALLSALLSNTTATLLLIPIALSLTPDKALQARFALTIAFAASIGGIITPIGTPPNLILLGFLEEHHLPAIGFMQWIWLALPLAVAMLFILVYLMAWGMRAQTMSLTHLDDKPLTDDQHRLLFIMGTLVVLLFLNSPIEPYYSGLGLNEKAILLGFGILLFLPGAHFLEWKDSHKIPFQIVLLFGAGFSIATAFNQTGLAKEFADFLLQFTHVPPLFLVLIISLLISLAGLVTSNTAVVAIILPITYQLAIQAHLDTRLFLMAATICASYTFVLPISTPPNAIAIASGVVSVKEMMIFGAILNLIGILTILVASQSLWQMLL